MKAGLILVRRVELGFHLTSYILHLTRPEVAYG